MAKKNKTPESILNAPRLEPVYLIRHTGLSRAVRRRLRPIPEATNQVYRKPENA